MGTKAYCPIVEGLEPPDSDVDDDIGETVDDQLSQSARPCPARHGEAESTPTILDFVKASQNGDTSEVVEATRPKKKPRRS